MYKKYIMRKSGKNLYKQIERNFGLYGNKDNEKYDSFKKFTF